MAAQGGGQICRPFVLDRIEDSRRVSGEGVWFGDGACPLPNGLEGLGSEAQLPTVLTWLSRNLEAFWSANWMKFDNPVLMFS